MFALDKIKRAYQKLPPALSYPLIWLPHKLIAGSSYNKTLGLLARYDSLRSVESRLNFEKETLRQALEDAIYFVPFYRDWAKSKGIKAISDYTQLFDFPILSKEEVQDRISDFIDDRCGARYQVHTGGTSGKQLNFYHSNECYGKEWAFIANFLSEGGVSVDDRRYSIRGVDIKDKDSLYEINPVYKELIISPHANTSEGVERIFNNLASFNGSWIHGYPSTVYQFCLALRHNGLSLPAVKAVLLVSEKVYDFQRSVIEEVLGAKIISFYGMSERVVFAPLTEGRFTPHRCYGVSEIIDGEHVATGFINSGTRLVRYRTGDALTGEVDSTGLITSFSSFEGRWGGDFLVGRSGAKINMTVLNTHSDLLNRIEKYQFRQTRIGYCDLLLQSEHYISNEEIEKIRALFQAKLGKSIFLSCWVVKEIETTKRGKHKFVNSML